MPSDARSRAIRAAFSAIGSGANQIQQTKDFTEKLSNTTEVGIGNLEYDKYLKGYKPTEGFRPQVTQGLADEYLHLMARK